MIVLLQTNWAQLVSVFLMDSILKKWFMTQIKRLWYKGFFMFIFFICGDPYYVELFPVMHGKMYTISVLFLLKIFCKPFCISRKYQQTKCANSVSFVLHQA